MRGAVRLISVVDSCQLVDVSLVEGTSRIDEDIFRYEGSGICVSVIVVVGVRLHVQADPALQQVVHDTPRCGRSIMPGQQ